MIYGSFITRMMAGLIDLAIMLCITWGFTLLLCYVLGVDSSFDALKNWGGMQHGRLMINMGGLINLLYFVLIVALMFKAVVFAYDGLPVASRFRTTPGKWLFALVVVDEAGQRLSLGQSMSRAMCKMASLSIVIGPFWTLFKENKQSLHDIMAKTLVIKRSDCAANNL